MSDVGGAMERLAQLLYVLRQGGSGGVAAAALLEVVRYGATDTEGRRRQLSRDIDQLRQAGWDIRNDAPPGEDARYRLVAGDLRLRVEFAPDEQAELQRIARIAGLPVVAAMLSGGPGAAGAAGPDADDDAFVAAAAAIGPMDPVLHAVRRRCRLRFVYKGVPREVHPWTLHSRSTGWYLSATETSAGPGGQAKLFRLDRMSDVEADEPGTAREFSGDPDRISIDPITWQVDRPVVAEVETTPEHRPHVVDLLGSPVSEDAGSGGTVLLRIPVTNRASFRGRLYELDVRARLVGPDDLRDEVRRDLYAVMAGHPA